MSVLPFHHPLIVAEEYAFADNLCGGRLDFAIGSGFSPVEYKMFDMSAEEARERYWEAFDVLLKAWTLDEFSHKGFKEYQNIGITHVICMVNFGGVPMEDVCRTMELVSTELMPRFQ